jgi:hypothetical protein
MTVCADGAGKSAVTFTTNFSLSTVETNPLRRRTVVESDGLYVLLRAQATRNRYRLRWCEAVRDPSTALALLASVRMTNMLRRFGQVDQIIKGTEGIKDPSP